MFALFFMPRPRAGADPDARLERISPSGWKEFTQHPFSVIVLTKSDCKQCHHWRRTLTSFFEKGGADWTRGVRFGDLALDQSGMLEFKRANPWLKERVKQVPYTILYADGAIVTTSPGTNLRRLANQLKRIQHR